MDGFFTALLNKVRIRNGVGVTRNTDNVIGRTRFEFQSRCPFVCAHVNFRRAVIDFGNARGNHDAVDLHRLDLPLHVFDLAGIVAPTLDGQLVAARVGLLRDLHGVVVISTQRFITELDRDRRELLLTVIGQILDCYRRALKADRRNGDGDFRALGIAATGADDEVGMFPSGKIGGQLVFYAVDPFHRRGRRGTLQLIPCVGGHGHVIYPAARFQRHRSRRTICHGRRDFFLIRAYRVQHDALDGCFLHGDFKPTYCFLVAIIRPITVFVLEGIALLQQIAEGQIGHLFIGNRHLTNSALRRTGVLDRRSGVHAQRIDVVTVQIEEERIVDHHRSSGHVLQQLQRAAVVIERINERVVEEIIIGDIVALCYAGGELLAADRASAALVYRSMRAGVAAGARAVGKAVRMLLNPNVIQKRSANFSSVDEVAVIVVESTAVRQQIKERAAGIGIPDLRECAAGEENGIGIASTKVYLLLKDSALYGQLAIVYRDFSIEGTTLDNQIALFLHIQKIGASHPPVFPSAVVLDDDLRTNIEFCI